MYVNGNIPCNVCGLGMCIDVAPFVEYMLLCMLMAIGRCSRIKLKEGEKAILAAMHKKGIGCEITVKNACKVLHSSNTDYVRSMLNNLVGYKILSKRKEGNKNIYRLER